MRKKNLHHIAIVSNTSWYIYNFRRNLINALLKADYTVTAVAPKDEFSERVRDIGCTYRHIHIDNHHKNPVKDLKTIFDFHRIYSNEKPDVILHYTPKPNIYGTIAAGMNRIPAINNIAGLGNTFIQSGIVNLIVRVLYRVSQMHAAKVFFQNPDDLDLFMRARLVPGAVVDLLPGSGVDVSRFTPQPGNSSGEFTFLLIARLLWEKGVGEYAEAARALKENYSGIEFQLLGFIDESTSRSVSADRISKWEQAGYVKWLGSADDVRPFIAASDCVVLPSYREGTPRSLLEAASMGKPIITTDAVGCRQVVDDGVNGFLCKVKDSLDLAAAMEKMFQLNSRQRHKMGEMSRKKMLSEFDETIVIDKYLKAIQALVSF